MMFEDALGQFDVPPRHLHPILRLSILVALIIPSLLSKNSYGEMGDHTLNRQRQLSQLPTPALPSPPC